MNEETDKNFGKVDLALTDLGKRVAASLPPPIEKSKPRSTEPIDVEAEKESSTSESSKKAFPPELQRASAFLDEKLNKVKQVSIYISNIS